MCGIAGIVGFAATPVDASALRRACAAQRHRGPDHAGIWIDGPVQASVGLAATRLAVQDPSAAGHQPFHHASGRYHLVFNGELYNFRELRRELTDSGERFLTDGDTEVVLAACIRWGPDAFSHFNGMWALAFYDSETREGFLSRDRFGVKPLLYAHTDRALTFASELQALTILGEFDRDINSDALLQLVQFGYIAHPDTIYAGARRLAPGHFLRFDARTAHAPTRYFDPLADLNGEACVDYTEACGRVRRTLADAVVARRVSDVPIGTFLSGGLDSSIVTYHLAAAMGRPVDTFAVGYADQRTYNEAPFARLVAHRLGTEHHELILTQRDVLEAIPQILDHLGEPVGDSSIIPTALVSQFARRAVTVALSGDGGDEIFGGYWRYLGHESLGAYRRIPAVLRRGLVEPTLRRLAASKSSTAGNRIRQLRKLLRAEDDDSMARHVAWSRILAPEAEDIFPDRRSAAHCANRVEQAMRVMTAGLSEADGLNRILAGDLQYSLPADMLHKVDLASMMHSLEVRVPFLDPRVVRLGLSLPGCFKIDRGMRKRILIDAYRGRLPDEVLDRPKQGFEVPIGELLRGPLRELFRATVSRDVIESFGLLSYPGVERIYEEHLARRGEHADVLFALLSLCWWRRKDSQCSGAPG